MQATSQLAKTTLGSVLGWHELNELLAERDRLNADIQGIPREEDPSFGIKVANVEITRVDLDESLVPAIAQQVDAERDIIIAEGKAIR